MILCIRLVIRIYRTVTDREVADEKYAQETVYGRLRYTTLGILLNTYSIYTLII